MILVNTPTIEGNEIKECLGIVKGEMHLQNRQQYIF